MRPFLPFIIRSLGLALCLLALPTCDRAAPVDSRLSGEYVYVNKYWQVEVLILREDNTYSHELYKDERTFIAYGTPFSAVSGKITTLVTGQPGAEIMDLNTGPWYARDEPEVATATLVPTTSFTRKRPALCFDPVGAHFLFKLARRSDIKYMHYTYPN